MEKAIRSVAAVSDASVNLVEGAAYVLGGDPQKVVDAVVDQGYPSRLAAEAGGVEFTLQFSQALPGNAQTRANKLLRIRHTCD